MTRLYLFVLLSLLFFHANICAQTTDSLKFGLNYYASFRGHFQYYNKDLTMQENGSRLGFEFSEYGSSSRYFMGAEIGINLFSGSTNFNIANRTSSGFFVLDQSQTKQLFAARTGYMGVDLGKYGTFKLGKQYGAYYDIAAYTDQFNVFGCNGSNAYPANSDGGDLGTGRANQSLTYRNKWGKWYVGVQGLFGSALDHKFSNGIGASVQYQINPLLKVGVAYNKAYVSPMLISKVIGFKANPQYMIMGLSYENKKWYTAALLSRQTNGDLVSMEINNESNSVVFDAYGVEYITRYKQHKTTFLVGYNGLFPSTKNLPLSHQFMRSYIIAGFEYKPIKRVIFYGEGRISTGNDHYGLKENNIGLFGLRIDFNGSQQKTIHY